MSSKREAHVEVQESSRKNLPTKFMPTSLENWPQFGKPKMFSIRLCGVCLTTSFLQDWWLAVNDAEGLEER